MMEAQAFGIPIISTNVGGTSEIVKDGQAVLGETAFALERMQNVLIN